MSNDDVKISLNYSGTALGHFTHLSSDLIRRDRPSNINKILEVIANKLFCAPNSREIVKGQLPIQICQHYHVFEWQSIQTIVAFRDCIE